MTLLFWRAAPAILSPSPACAGLTKEDLGMTKEREGNLLTPTPGRNNSDRPAPQGSRDYHYPVRRRRTDGFASEGEFCAINKHQPPRPATPSTPPPWRGIYLARLPDQVGQ
ncbi:MAG: hypothetical protein LBB23_00205 [Rickettsiales bacterium]|nr:hypothetical protein [Rickettsiales bacterium]